MAGGGKGRRTYARDNRGRFASTGTARSRPAPKQAATRGTNRLTRNNSGQIVGVGRNGATARGGRLRTGAGNLRARQTARLARMGGTIAKPKGLKPGAITRKAKPAQKPATKPAAAKPAPPKRPQVAKVARKPPAARKRSTAAPKGPATSRLMPGELMNAVARPVNTMARPTRSRNPFGAKDKVKMKNVQIALSEALKLGTEFGLYKEGKRRGGQAIARVITSYGGSIWSRDGGTMPVPARQRAQLNQLSGFWKNPARRAVEARRSGFLSTSSPLGPIHHEIGHTKDPTLKKEYGWKGGVDQWFSNYYGKGEGKRSLAKRVSQYAAASPAEFIAETYAGLKTGRRYDYQVMRAYREAMGLSPTPAARRRSRVRRPKP